MDKRSGQEFLKDYNSAKQKLTNVETKINKRYIEIRENYRRYLTKETLGILAAHPNLSTKDKCAVIMEAEAEYHRRNSNQGELF
jgi:5-methylcytosine-specific restriction endonuclease McrBC GTP-binding regulatory subunit McrB